MGEESPTCAGSGLAIRAAKRGMRAKFFTILKN
jgi:hypothetical protein